MYSTDDLFKEINVKVDKAVLDSVKPYYNDWKRLNPDSISLGYGNDLGIELKFSNVMDNFIEEFGPKIFLLNIPPHTNGFWHIDHNVYRSSAINLILDEYVNHFTFFSQAPSMDDIPFSEYKTYLCPYRYQYPMIINAHEKPHTVFNISDTTRWVLSFASDQLTYKETVKWFADKQAISN